ncbi:hypothetical protein BG452_05010 [Streptomyces sp. CBMA123]|nr:hypothetical protein [Streptomyces sp. CBMA123]
MREMDVPNDTVVKIISWNVEHGVKLAQACDWLAQQRPDIVLWQEMQPGDLDKVALRLNMLGYAAAEPPAVREVAEGMLPGASRNANAILLRKNGPFVVQDQFDHSWMPWHPAANITVKMREERSGALSQKSLALVSHHLCYFSAAVQRVEADWFSTFANKGLLTVIGMDRNSFEPGQGPDWDEFERTDAQADVVFRLNRTFDTGDGTRVTNDYPVRVLNQLRYIDVCHFAADKLGMNDAAGITAGWGKPHQYGSRRIDGITVSPSLAALTISAWVADTEELRRTSDHLPTVWTVSKPVLWLEMNAN